jgi:hypothetical protein
MKTPRSFWHILLFISALLAALALLQAIPGLRAGGISLTRSRWSLLLGMFILNIPAAVLAMIGIARGWFDGLLQRIETTSVSSLVRGLAILLLVALAASFWYIRLRIFPDVLPQLFPSLWLFLWISIPAMLLFKVITGFSFEASFASVVLPQVLLFRLWGILGAVTDFPFTLEYSETSRFYYGSLWFSRSLYGMDLPLSTLHPSRYLLQSIPFLISGLPLWAHRLWQALLWIILTGTASWLLARRLKLSNIGLTVLVAMWGFVFFLQGAVYYHLQVCVIIILLGVSVKHPWRSLIAVLFASAWAGISRVNWFPVPAMLAIALYLLEQPRSATSSLWKYLLQPFLWAVTGLAVALLSQALYIPWSGNSNNAGDFGSAFTSDLIWSRLLPNATYPMGVVPAILLVSSPLLMGLFFYLRGKTRDWHFIRPLGIFAMLAVLFLGGLVVSTKIGGGGDIHNMDAFIVLLGITAASFFADRVAPETGVPQRGSLPAWLIPLIVLVPALFSIPGVAPRFSYDSAQAQADLNQLRAAVADATEQGGDVLFISERHLLTFHMLDDVTLVPEYEVVTLMEMAMSGNEAYLEKFRGDLASHRFALIVTRKQRVVKKEGEPFAEENNVWIDAISTPLLCYYQRSFTLESSNTLVLVPSTTVDCP